MQMTILKNVDLLKINTLMAQRQICKNGFSKKKRDVVKHANIQLYRHILTELLEKLAIGNKYINKWVRRFNIRRCDFKIVS